MRRADWSSQPSSVMRTALHSARAARSLGRSAAPGIDALPTSTGTTRTSDRARRSRSPGARSRWDCRAGAPSRRVSDGQSVGPDHGQQGVAPTDLLLDDTRKPLARLNRVDVPEDLVRAKVAAQRVPKTARVRPSVLPPIADKDAAHIPPRVRSRIWAGVSRQSRNGGTSAVKRLTRKGNAGEHVPTATMPRTPGMSSTCRARAQTTAAPRARTHARTTGTPSGGGGRPRWPSDHVAPSSWFGRCRYGKVDQNSERRDARAEW